MIPAYQELQETPAPFTTSAVMEALESLRFPRARLAIHSINEPIARVVAARMPLAIIVDERLNPNEWYVEHDGRRVGSIGR